MTQKEIAELQAQLRDRLEKLAEIYGKLVKAGVIEMPEDFLDAVLSDDDELVQLKPEQDEVKAIYDRLAASYRPY